jgi:hypothetical protein
MIGIGLTRTIDPEHFFPTIEAAVSTFSGSSPGAGEMAENQTDCEELTHD